MRPQDGIAHLAADDLYLDNRDLEAYTRPAGLPETKVEGIVGLAEVAYAKGHQALPQERPDPRYETPLQKIKKNSS